MRVVQNVLFICVLNCFTWTSVLAQTGESYVVANVQSNDVLNVRAGPGVKFMDIGDVPHDGELQVIGFNEDKTWAKVVWQEDVAWVSARFISKTIVWPDLSSETLSCGGVEPFWSADITKDNMSFAVIGQNKHTEAINWKGPAQGRPASFIQGITAGPYTTVLRQQICSDGMSDQDYPWAIVMMKREEESVQMFEGCCR